MTMTWKRVVFAALLLAALGAFAWTMRRFSRMVLAGDPSRGSTACPTGSGRCWSSSSARRRSSRSADPRQRRQRLVTAIGSRYHVLIFWGFIVITIGTGETADPGAVSLLLAVALLMGDAAAGWLADASTWPT